MEVCKHFLCRIGINCQLSRVLSGGIYADATGRGGSVRELLLVFVKCVTLTGLCQLCHDRISRGYRKVRTGPSEETN